jgi:hypothetical protein
MTKPTRPDRPGRTPIQWQEYFRRAGILVEVLDAAKSGQARATILGNFLSQNQGREVPITIGGRTGRARLCVEEGGKRQRRYYFQIAWDEAPPPDSVPPEKAPLTDGLADEPGPTSAGQSAPAIATSRFSPAASPLPVEGLLPAPAGPDQETPAEAEGNQEAWS